MKPHEAKALITGIVWLLLAVVSVIAVLNVNSLNMDDWAVVVLALAPLGLAIGTTAIIWDAKVDDHTVTVERTEREMEKNKRVPRGQSRMEMLLEMMDDDEREAFKQSLKEQVLRDMQQENPFVDGEIPTSLASLMDDEGRQGYRS